MYCKIDYFVPLFACLFNYLSANSLSAEKATEDVICNTNYGKLKGFVAENLVDGLITKANVFLGIPFAKPPIAELRFEKPIAPNKWKDIQNASAFSPACFPHHSKEFRNGQASSHSEDCLYLNVIAPHSKSPEPNGYPVLVFIHGGAFAIGSAVEFGWESFADLFVSQDLVVVTIQYRLGPLGFAASGDESFPGNLGLWDARMAMKYVNENIHHFGGDPKRVTAWGHSAGSAIVDGLSLSTHSQDLFAQSIQMSGAVFGEWTTSNRVIQESDKLAAALNCDKHLADSKLLKKWERF
uniref:Carboxylesterase type B domain-containing protein n=1 Tax=Ditylenchus dipsaci TaxID=166011 RepID=A0A915E7P9_9BILA